MSVDLRSEQTLEAEMDSVRRLLSRYLVGRGIELGPGHYAYPAELPGTEVLIVDRWTPDESRALLPELGDDVEFPEVDIVCNLDVDRLKPLDDASQDFVIASHVLEHLADPIGILAEIHRVLRPGGTALILLPDRRRTFDANRPPTTLEHLVAEYEAQVTEVDDAHIVEFLRLNGVDDFAAFERMSPADQAAHLELHRQRSIHAHCWQEDEFLEVLLYSIEQLGQDWELLDGVLAEDEGPQGFEFGYVLRRGLVPLSAAQRRERFAATWELWVGRRRREHRAAALHSVMAPALPVTPEPWTDAARQLARRAARRVTRLGPRSAV